MYLTDFQKLAALINAFLMQLSEREECASLRDALNLALLQLQRYYRNLRNRLQMRRSSLQESSLTRTLTGVLDPFSGDGADKFSFLWIDVENLAGTMRKSMRDSTNSGDATYELPEILKFVRNGDVTSLTALTKEGRLFIINMHNGAINLIVIIIIIKREEPGCSLVQTRQGNGKA